MGTTLTKPVLLDETGQDIVDKLDEIKTAIGSTGEFVPIKIQITTPPTKTIYSYGERLDLTGMVVKLIASNGSEFDITSECATSPADGTILEHSEIVGISYYWYKDDTTFHATLSVTVKELSSIAITNEPTKTEYYVGDNFDPTGMEVTATFSDGSTQIITAQCVFSPSTTTPLTTNDSSIAISYTYGNRTKTTTQAIEVIEPIYGVEWDGTGSTKWTRTDLASDFVDPDPYYQNMEGDPSSPFDNRMPWSGMQRVVDPEGGVLVSIPKYYYKLSRDGYKMKLQISPNEFEGSRVSPAHQDRGDGQGERDVVYVGAYLSDQSYGKSTSGVYAGSWSKSNARTRAHDLGDTIWQYDYLMHWTILLLYLVEYADWNIQNMIGYGGGNNSNVQTGTTDDINYHTGTKTATRNVYGETKYRHIEDLWSNGEFWVDGVYINTSNQKLYGIKNPSNFADTNGGVLVSDTYVFNNSGNIYRWVIPEKSGMEDYIFPEYAYGTSYSNYVTDAYYYSSNGVGIVVGGSTDNYQSIGLFAMNCTKQTSQSGKSRIMKLPNNS